MIHIYLQYGWDRRQNDGGDDTRRKKFSHLSRQPCSAGSPFEGLPLQNPGPSSLSSFLLLSRWPELASLHCKFKPSP